MFQDETKKQTSSRIKKMGLLFFLQSGFGKYTRKNPWCNQERKNEKKSQRLFILHSRKFVYSLYHPPNFRLYFTLLSECFSTFAQATCLLSVSLKYLVLEVTYSPTFTQVCQPVLLFVQVPLAPK